jgi:amino acid adenylation domain-containing protein
MDKKNTFSCYIIGNDNITLQCAEVILANNHQLLGLISPSKKINQWCQENSVPCINSIKEFEIGHMDKRCDFLFSIANGDILPESILKHPLIYAINYHNAPLPKYAGLYATSWAILNGETEHAISWHKMQKEVDAGDILKQSWFSIDGHDTALSLNLKCYEHAIQAFHELVSELATNTMTPTQQNLACRSYYSLKDKPKNLGFISWKEPSENIDRLCRAFTFGNYLNELVTPKVLINGELFVVKSYRKLIVSSGGMPGKIVHISNTELQVTTGTTDIALSKLISLSGKEYDVSSLVDSCHLLIGQQLPEIDLTYVKKLSTYSPIIHPKTEKFWIKEHLKCIKGGVNFLSQLSTKNDTKTISCGTKTIIKTPKNLLKQLNKHSKSAICNPKHILFTSVLIYLYRLNNYKNFSVQYSHASLKSKINELSNFLAEYIPLTTNFDSEITFSTALSQLVNEDARLANYETHSKDIFIRYPEIKGLIDEIEISISFFDVRPPLPSADNKKLNISISEDGSCVHLHNKTNYKLHEASYLFFNNMKQHIYTLLEDILENPDKRLYELSLIDKKEKNCLMHVWNNTRQNYEHEKLLHRYIEEQVSQNPESIAATFNGLSMSYDELNKKSNKLANYLVAQGAMSNEIVGVYIHRSLEMLISILAVLKSGAAYLPLDPHYPDKRINYMLNNSRSKFLLTHRTTIKKRLKGYDGLIIDVGEILCGEPLSCQNQQINGDASDLAYVIYTSGTTGTPKGVAISHKAVCNHMAWMKNAYDFHEHDVFLLKTPFSFDASVWEIFMPLLVGGKIVIAPDDAHASPEELIQIVRKNSVSILQLVPSMLRELTLTQGFSTCTSLRHLFCGGEVLLPETIHAFFEHNPVNTKLHNLYGPTEATIDAITLTCTATDATNTVSRIGRPISNINVYVLDDKMQLVPTGILGELYLSGDCLAQGYLNNPKLTLQKFLNHPFSTRTDEKVYKTGDLVKWQDNGIIEYHGRRDSQVKIRGFRIEISEIESCLEKIPFVYQCIVKHESGEDGSLFLSAYMVLIENTQISATEIRSALKKDIPDYMIPSRFFVVDKLLTTPNGKIDRKSVLYPSRQLYLHDEHVAPNNATESTLHDIWCSVLKKEHLGVYDDFFALGGHSLSAMQIIARIRDYFLTNLTIRMLFDFPTISSLSKEIEKLQQMGIAGQEDYALVESIMVPIKKSGDKTALFLVHPIGGSVFWYKSLGMHLDIDRPLYGIQDPGLDKKALFFESLEDMAQSYIEIIQTIQPHGPYILGGASFGSTVAIEMAKQLEEKNEKIIAIILLDGWAEYPSLQRSELHFKNMMREQNLRILEKHVQNNIHDSDFLLELQWHREKLLMQYKLPQIKSKLILFKAAVLTELFNYDAPLNWWDNYSSQRIERYLVPGDHETMFYEPNIKILASKLNDSLNEKNMGSSKLNDLIEHNEKLKSYTT